MKNKKKHLLEFLKTFNKIFYYIYPFPTGKLFIFADMESLKAVTYGYGLDVSLFENKIFEEKINGPLSAAIDFFDSYLLGSKKKLPGLDLCGYTEKERRVYMELIKISFGKVISYNDLSIKAGIKGGARFIGNTMAKNRFPVIIPCHRVIKSSGHMGNYTSGTAIKKFLLEHERALKDRKF